MLRYWVGKNVLRLFYLFGLAHSQIISDGKFAASKEHPHEEWHMDFIPTGYLPDSVYRELAWYSILQIQPLYHSTKNKVVAQWIWQNTVGRPHVIMEHQPQSTQSRDKDSYHAVVEEAVKWSREQRAAQDVLMENVKTGGNGLTVRTVISANKKTVYIIQNGKFYECPSGSEPDLEVYRVQANMHERKCTFGKESIPVAIDPCIEAESAQLEYSFHEGWVFCFGDGERDNNYFTNGVLDCGNKSKIALDTFLADCAIDNNIVITYDYFGDEPRKDLLHNTTLCTTWDPCRLSYLYRYEPPIEVPVFPTTTQDPCDTTICPECVETKKDDWSRTTSNEIRRTTIIQWIPTSSETYYPYRDQALVVGKSHIRHTRVWLIRAIYMGQLATGKLIESLDKAYLVYNNTEICYNGDFELALANPNEVQWQPASKGDLPEGALIAGKKYKGQDYYICRVHMEYEITPGSLVLNEGTCSIGYVSKEYISNEYEVLCSTYTIFDEKKENH